MRLAVAFFTFLLVGLTAASAYLLIQSCGVRLPFSARVISFCETAETLDRRTRLDRTFGANDDLEIRIAALEHDLATMICKAEPPPPPPPPPPPKPKKAQTPSGLDPKAFDKNDISVMEGCWQLSSDYDVREIRTGEITRFRYWRICFDKRGNGRETMRATNGSSCSGPLKGRMRGGKLVMREPRNLKCDNGASIFRRDITCSLNARGVANCDTHQPEINGRGTAILRRARR